MLVDIQVTRLPKSLICQSTPLIPRQRGTTTRCISYCFHTFEQELLTIKAGLGKTKRQKRYDTIIERIGRLKERYKVGNLYTIKVEQADGKAIDLQFGKNDQAQAKEDAIGTYLLRTNRLDLSGDRNQNHCFHQR